MVYVYIIDETDNVATGSTADIRDPNMRASKGDEVSMWTISASPTA